MSAIKDILANKAERIAMKKAERKFADPWSTPAPLIKQSATKADEADNGVLPLKIVGSTNYWMDSHKDVHVAGNWAKTIADGGRKFHLHDHKFEVTAQVGKISSLNEQPLSWKSLGVDKDGNTSGLVADTQAKRDMNPRVYEDYKSGEIQQHSVGMQYIKLDLAVSPDAEQSEEENKVWNEIFPLLGNPETAEKNGYFWVVREAKLIEISAVLMGSNSLTPTLEDKQEPLSTPANKEAVLDTSNEQFFNNLKF